MKKLKRIPEPKLCEGPEELTRTSLLYWWPIVKDLGIPVPKTRILLVNRGAILDAMEGIKPLGPEFMESVYGAALEIGYPLFLRTDLQSGKHGWKKTCFVPNAESLYSHMFGVAEENELGACFFGPGYNAFVFREFLDLDVAFTAFYGDMPINRERRYFIRDGKVECHHPYWPEEAFKGQTAAKNWKKKLRNLNEEPDEEIVLLRGYAQSVGRVLPEYWSVDFARDKNQKWYLIDMALGDESYHWKGCSRGGG
jgi:ATP-grasp domain-containing protein